MLALTSGSKLCLTMHKIQFRALTYFRIFLKSHCIQEAIARRMPTANKLSKFYCGVKKTALKEQKKKRKKKGKEKYVKYFMKA